MLLLQNTQTLFQYFFQYKTLVMQNTLLSLNIQLPIVIVDLIIEYKRHIDYAGRVWEMYSLNFWLSSVNTEWGGMFEPIFYEIRRGLPRSGIDEDLMAWAVIRYGQAYTSHFDDVPNIPEFEVFRQHQWNISTMPQFEGDEYWLLHAINQIN